MDIPKFLHQQQKLKYVSVPNSSRPHYPDDANFHNPRYQHRHHHIPRPQPQPQLQPQPQSQPLPPPPPRLQTPSFQSQPPRPPPPQSSSMAHNPQQMHPYSPGQSQFALANLDHDRTSFEDDFPRSSYLHRNFVVSANVSRQLPLEDDRPRHRLPEFEPEIRLELWEQPRVLAENFPERSHTPLDFDCGSQKFQLDHKPMSPYNVNSKLRHPSEGISRFRAEYVDGFESKHRDELSRGAEEDNYSRRGSFLSSPGISFRDMGFASNPSLSVRDMDSDLESYNPRYGSSYNNDLYRSGSRREGVYHDNQRRVHDRKFSRESHNSSFERGNSEVSNGDGAHIGSVKREYFGPELGRYSSRGSREDAHEFNRTPRKQLQKKSALLRLQKGKSNHRNVENEQLHYAGYHDNSNSSSFRRKDQYVYEEEEREGSPVELDVSFKSNSLVAKAIVAPSSSSDVTGADLTCKGVKFRKDSLSDKGCSNPGPSKLDDNTANVDVSMHVGNDKSSHEKDTTQSEGVVSSGVMNTCDTSTQAHLSVTNQSDKKTEVKKSSECAEINNKNDTKVGSDNVSLKVAKKKKVVRKIIKKVVRPRPHVNSQQKRKRDELVKADACVPTPSEASGTHKGVSFSCPCPNEVKMVHEGKKVEGFAAAIESEEHGICVDSSRKCIDNIDKIGNSLGAFSRSSSSEEIMIDKGPELSVQGMPTISNNNKDLVRSLGVSTIAIPEIAYVGNTKESHPSGDSLLFDGALEKDSIPVTLPVGGDGDSSLLNPGEIKMHNNLMNTYCCNSRTSDVVSGLTLSKEESRVCGVGTNDVLSKLPCSIQVTTLHDNSVQKEVSNATWSAESCAKVGLSGLGETTMDVDSSLHIDKTTSLGDNIRNCEKNTTISSSCTVDHMQPYTDGAAELSENGAMKNFPKTKISFENNKGDKPLTSKKRTVRSQLDFSNTTDTALDTVNVSNPTATVDTMLSFSADNQNNVVVSCMGNLDVALPPGEDQAVVLHQNSSSDGIFDSNLIARDNVKYDIHFTSPHNRKKRKVLDSHLAMPSRATSETDEQPSPASCAVSFTSNEVSMQQNTDLNRSIVDTSSAATNLMHSENGITELSEGFSDTVVAVRSFFNDTLKSESQLGCGLIFEKSIIPTVELLCPEGSRHEQKNVDAAVMVAEDQHAEAFNMESRREELLGVSASRGQVIAQEETPHCTIPSVVQDLDIDQRFSFTDMESDNLLVEDELSSLSNSLSLPVDQNGVSTVTSSDEAMEFVPDALRNIGSQQSSFTASNVHISDATSGSQISNETCREDGKLVRKFVDTDGSNVTTEKSLFQCTDANLKSDCATERDQAIEEKSISLPLQDSRSFPKGVNVNSADSYNGQKNQLGNATPRIFLGHTSFAFTSTKKKATSSHANPRTWHRNSVSSASPPGSKPFSRTDPSRSQLSDRDGKIQSTSYVRKGNSLVRKPSQAAALPQRSPGFSLVHRLNSPGLDESKSSIERVGAGMSNGILRKGETKASCKKSRTSLVHSGTELPNVPISSRDCTSSPSAGPHLNGCIESTSDPISSTENFDTTEFVKDSLTSESQNGLLTSLDNQSELDDGNLASVNPKRVVYVKRKSNQLVATSDSTDFSVPNVDKMQASSFDGYFKRRKNQLIRTSLESHTKQPIVMPDDNLSMDVQITLKAISSRRLNKRRSQKVVAKTFKRSSNSLVWTLCNSQPSNNDSGTISHQKVYPHLFPWKRTTYWRNFTQNWNSISKSNSLAISGKLLLSRKRDTVYTRSINGFSLRKSKVLSVGGSSLKWSKSIDRHSKKANEEATLAVAAVEKKKREQKGSKDRNHSSRERIFRVGLCRYKMDPSRRTLQRISDDESSFAATIHPDKDAKRSYIPRRLVIGNNEYVRIGNGNQLVRDPKKRTRILASEKVRWSLHTARVRLAKKRKYCQFFTRFGRCNKDNGRCHFIHDPSKIAVCTKFLNGLCSNANCKLTHKVIPERMPDCSYFLQGLCTNKHCPYRHVNVNPKASTCEGFLRGYCADGNEIAFEGNDFYTFMGHTNSLPGQINFFLDYSST
ncbi:uncharacterized protein LOC133805264 isoform X2 [Humulus lupulus]|uniref:uncharacterized protein LOC133805264 isoform X2 n=1 Tax=Humulus lupulus TaxID=3486 RepID=UPI002B4024F8|nr:uncharacterized protein LOC133805264 isoform X2 [Humulus lupulus]